MERLANKSILEWKSSPNRKPLILSGARQVGKTWLLKEFGRREYASCIYINCDKDAFAAAILAGNAGFEEYKGAFTEAYVLAEMLASANSPIFYFSAADTTVEIDFLVQKGTEVIPIEVKAAENLNSKSLKTFVTANKGLHGVRFSLAPYREQDWMRNIPLYAVSAFFSH